MQKPKITLWRKYSLCLLLVAISSGSMYAQQSYPDTSRWIGQWADEGDLTYSLEAMIVIQKNGDAKGIFDWTMIYSPYSEHRGLTGNTGREILEGKYHKYSSILRLENVAVIQDVEIISGDKYLIQFVNSGEKMVGQNFNPNNFRGSLYALRVPETPTELHRPPPSEPPKASLPKAKKRTNSPLEIPPTPKTQKPPIKLSKTSRSDAISPTDFGGRTILTKEEVSIQAQEVRIEIWDKSIVDGDVISLEWNGKRLLSRYRVLAQHKSMKLKLKPGENLLVMHAENLGRIPPNTAAVAIYQKNKVRVYILNSDLGKSEAIRILRTE